MRTIKEIIASINSLYDQAKENEWDLHDISWVFQDGCLIPYEEAKLLADMLSIMIKAHEVCECALNAEIQTQTQ